MEELQYMRRYSLTETQKILARFIDRYIDRDKLRRYYLLWNSFQQRPAYHLEMEEIERIPVPPETEVFFYDERQQILYRTRMAGVIRFVQNLEPWDETDVCIFEDDMAWVIAVTHEDQILYWTEASLP